MNKLFIIVLTLVSFNSIVSAQEVWGQGGGPSYSMPAIEVGFRSGSAKVENSNSDKQGLGYQLGATAVFNISEKFGLKTGLMYTERAFKSTVATSNIEGKITYFDIPFFAMYKLEDFVGLYIGPTISFQIGDDVKGTTTGFTDIESMVVPITLGAQFKFAPTLGINVFFENVSGDLAQGVDKYRAVGATLMIALD